MISFLVSQNNNIPRITKILKGLRASFGQLITERDKCKFYSFPSCAQLAPATEARLTELGLGYRAKYIVRSVEQLTKLGGEKYLLDLRQRKPEEIRESLLSFYGIGNKVADCIALFSLNCHWVTPIDTHVWQIYNKVYARRDASVPKTQTKKKKK